MYINILDGILGFDIGSMASDILRFVSYFIAEIIYPIIIHLYDVFSILTKGRLLDNEVLSELSNRLGLLLGIIMLFIVTTSAIKMLVDPDKVNDKEIGFASIIKKILLVIVMFGTSTFAFNTLYYIQKVAIDSHIVEKLLIPNKIVNANDFGDFLSYKLFTTYYYIDPVFEGNDDYEVERCRNMLEGENNILWASVKQNKDFSVVKSCLNEKITVGEEEVYIIKYDALLIIAVGGFVIYFLLCYCISVGIRMIQLAFLEIISPMAFVSYLSPKKDNMFAKWIKLYSATFLDAFVRIAIINFAVFLIDLLLRDVTSWSFWETLSGMPEDIKMKAFITIIMVIAILSFAKKAPELIKDLFPASASKLSLGLGTKNFVGLGSMLAGTAAVGIGTVGRMPGLVKDVKNAQGIGGKVGAAVKGIGAVGTGAVGGAVRGVIAGNGKTGLGALKAGQQAQAKANLARAQRIASGKGMLETMQDGVNDFLGMPSGYEGYNRDLSMSNAIKETLGGEDVIKHIREVRQSYIQKCAASGEIANADFLARYDDAEKVAMRQMYAFAHDSFEGSSWIRIDDSELGLHINEEYKTNLGIHEQIRNNEKRVGRTLNTFDDKEVTIYASKDATSGRVVKADTNDNWKADNNSIKNKIAKKTKGSSK